MKKILIGMAVAGGVLMGTGAWAQEMAIAEGKQVKLDYTLIVNKEQVETSLNKEPLDILIGSETIIPGLEKALIGMKSGEEKTIVVEAKDAYGDVDQKAFKEFPRSALPKTPEPHEGMVLQARAPNGEDFPAVIASVKGDKVVLDFNHPLAGKQLTFQVKIVSVGEPPAPAVTAPPVKK